jgi:hypothetical protein
MRSCSCREASAWKSFTGTAIPMVVWRHRESRYSGRDGGERRASRPIGYQCVDLFESPSDRAHSSRQTSLALSFLSTNPARRIPERRR